MSVGTFDRLILFVDLCISLTKVDDILMNGKYVNNNYLHEVHKSKNIMSTICVFVNLINFLR